MAITQTPVKYTTSRPNGAGRCAPGFTLIELSIVLVIIGLVVGGVLTGRDLIEAARVRAQIKQFDAFRAATVTFMNKYDAIPGDMTLAQATDFGLTNDYNIGGNGDGEITDATGASPLWRMSTEPLTYGWDLSEAGLISEDPDQTAIRLVNNAPLLSINPGASFLPFSYLGNIWLFAGITTDQPGGDWIGGNQTRYVFTPPQAYAIDQKTDDGMPSTGTVLATDIMSGTPFIYTVQALDATSGQCVLVGATTTYNITDHRLWCRLMLRLL